MAWIYEQFFNGLNDGDLNGQDSWSGDTDHDVQTTEKYEGAKGVANVSGDGGISRAVTGVSSGKWYWAMRNSSNSTGFSQVYFKDGTYNIFAIKFKENGKIEYRAEGGLDAEELQTYNANQWYVIEIEWVGGSTNTCKVRIHDGNSWSSVYNKTSYDGGNITSIILYKATGAFTSYYDTITPTDPTAAAGPADLKSVNAVALANIKSINGVAIADVKSVNGIA